MKQYKNKVQTIQNTVYTSTHITKTPTKLSKHAHTFTHTLQKVQTTTVQGHPNAHGTFVPKNFTVTHFTSLQFTSLQNKITSHKSH